MMKHEAALKARKNEPDGYSGLTEAANPTMLSCPSSNFLLSILLKYNFFINRSSPQIENSKIKALAVDGQLFYFF